MTENKTVKERLILFIRYLNIGQGKFESRCGLANGYVNNIRRSITPEKLQQIALQFPELNTGWLMTGEGEMLKEKEVEPNARIVGGAFSVGQRDDEVIMVNYVPVAAMATFIESVGSATAADFDKFPIVPKGNEMADVDKLCIFEVEGDSMYPTIPSGALILAKEIPERSWHYAEGVVVAVYNEFVVVKRIKRNSLSMDNILVLHSDNEKYGDMTVQLSDLRALYKAKRIISSEIR